jgi:predicted dehydrogenase
VLDIGPHILDLVEAALGPVAELTAQGDPHDWVAVQMLHESGARSDVVLSCASAIEPSRTEVELYGRTRALTVDARAAARGESFARMRAEFAEVARTGTAHPCDAGRGLELQRLVSRVTEALAASSA